MTYQPPAPPPGGTPPPPPGQPGQWGPPPGGNPQHRPGGFDAKTVNPLDWAILGIGALVFIFSFFGYYTWSYDFGPYGGGSVSFSAWHFGGGTFVAWFAMVFAVAGAAVVALELFAPTVKLPTSNRLLAFGLFGVSFLLYIIAIFAHENFGPNGGHGFSFWLSLVLALAGAVLCLMRVQQTGHQLPGPLSNLPNIGQHGPQGGTGGPSQPTYGAPPQQGYNAPPPGSPGHAAPPQQQPGYGTPPPPPPGYGPPQ